MSYNLTAIGDNSTGLFGLVQSVNNELMFGWFGIMLLISLAVIFLMAFMATTQDVKKSIAGSAFLTFGLALFLKMLSLISNLAIFVTLICCAVAIAFSFIGDKD